MRRWILLLVVCLPVLAAVASKAPRNASFITPVLAAPADDDFDMPLKEEEVVRQQYPLAASGDRVLDVDNVWGSIEVIGTNSDQVQVVIKKTIRAETKADLEKAKQEVTLEAGHDNSSVRLYVNGPFRCHNNGDGDCCCGWRDREGYVVKMDFQIQVPNHIRLVLRTVNEGNIKVEGVSGDFSIRNVNGRIDVQDAAGSGRAKTVNGGVKVSFRSNPTANSQFSTVNGPVELYFAQPLAADFRFKTFNGNVYTDYELQQLPPKTPEAEKRNGKFIFRADRFTNGRVGAGGPEISIDTLNGDIRVLQRHATL